MSILELYHNILEVRAVAGDNYLGGEDFTKALEKICLNKMGVTLSALSGKDQVRLYRHAEAAKKEINDKESITIECLLQDEMKRVKVTAKEFAAACEDLLQKIKQPVKRSLSDAGLSLPISMKWF